MNIVYVALTVILWCCIPFQNLNGQSFQADVNIWKNSWASCQKKKNPVPGLASSHWIQYDFGVLRNLSKTWVWNMNDPEYLHQGFKKVRIDYSERGDQWTHWGDMEFPKGTGHAIYSGFQGPDLQNIRARYVVITSLSNYGDRQCAGIAEIKFNLLPDFEELEEALECLADFKLRPTEIGPTSTSLLWNDSKLDAPYQLKITELLSQETMLVETASNSYTLDQLHPNTTYEIFVGAACDERVIWSPVLYITTGLPTSTNIPIEKEEVENDRVLAFPNPSNGVFQLRYEALQNEQLDITISDINGKIVYRELKSVAKGSNYLNVRMTQPTAGFYFMRSIGVLSGKQDVIRLLIKADE